VLGVKRWAALFGTHRFHTCYLSNEFAGLKATFLLLCRQVFLVPVGAFR